MKNKMSSFKEYYKAHPKRFWVSGAIIVLVLILVLTHKPASTVTVVPVTRGDLRSTILATGQVTSATDLELSFSTSGLVRTLPAVVGRKVYAGQVLGTLDNGNEYAALKSAQARYQKVVDGISNEDVAVAAAALAGAKSSLVSTQNTQNTLVESARRSLLNSDLTPIIESGTSGTTPSITGVYTGTEEGSYRITVYLTGGGSYSLNYSGLETGSSIVSSSAPSPLGTKGLFIQFPIDAQNIAGNIWTILLPNTKSANYGAMYNAYQNALKNRDSAIAAAETAVTQAQAALDLKKAPARTADINVAQADVDAARATYEKTLLIAPASGTIVHVNTKIGERTDAGKAVVVIQDVGNLYVEANINETNIAKVVVGQPVTMTLDAFGPDTVFTGKVIHIDPSATTTDGIANYKIKTSVQKPTCDAGAECPTFAIRPGMNANITITAWQKPEVIAVPKAAITTASDGASTIRVVTDEKKEKTEARAVTLGALGDGNLVEITSGLAEGEKIAVTK